MKTTKRQNREKLACEITVIKFEITPGGELKHYFNYRKQLSEADITRLKENFQSRGLDVRVDKPAKTKEA